VPMDGVLTDSHYYFIVDGSSTSPSFFLFSSFFLKTSLLIF
jgi:hypothetical protein